MLEINKSTNILKKFLPSIIKIYMIWLFLDLERYDDPVIIQEELFKRVDLNSEIIQTLEIINSATSDSSVVSHRCMVVNNGLSPEIYPLSTSLINKFTNETVIILYDFFYT